MIKKDFPISYQHDCMDCGATCLQMIAMHYGKRYSLETLRNLSFISREGASLMGVSDAAEAIGFRTLGLCLPLEKLKKQVPLPCILHWNQNHYVVCYKIKKQRGGDVFYIADPARSKIKLTEEEFKSHWLNTKRKGENCGIALTLQPGAAFYDREDEGKNARNHSIWHFVKYLIPYRKQLFDILLAMLIFMVLGLIFPFLTQAMVDVGIRDSNLNFVILILVAQFILSFTDMAVGFLQSWISLHVNTRINIAIVSDFWAKLMKLPIRFFDTKKTGDLMQRLGDHGRIENFLVNDSLNIIFSLLSFMVYSIILGYYSFSILGIFLFGHALYICWNLLFMRYWKSLDYKTFEIQAKDHSCVIQLIQGMQEIKLNNEEKRKRWEWERIQAKYFYNNIRGLKMGQIQNTGASFITRSTGIIVSFVVAKQVIDGEMSLGMMMAMSYIIGQVGGPISRFMGFLHSFQNAKISLERLNEIHNKEDEENTETQRSDLPQCEDICLEHLYFSYSGSPREYVLKDINIKIPLHKTTAIVGMSGSGKTTIMKLIQGFYDPQEGDIKIGDVPLRFINPRFWRSKLGSVMQEGFIFSDTIARNIAVGETEINKEKLLEAMKTANIEDFIMKLPLGVNTKIGMEGNGVSQGQKQRILIARAVYKNPEILLFDEATNALDTKNEKIIMTNLLRFYKGKTVIISAHRLSTIKNADKIIVLKEGRVIESGRHEELMMLKGEYFNLVENQMEIIHE